MSYGHTITLDVPFQEAVTEVKLAFGAQGSAPSPRSTSKPPSCRNSAMTPSRT